ncbi:hypothetical protein [Amycolatopsis sp. GM8]|uniref:hypothetical protein n=1 Tax=Amycolatopsis sp. GM8 TaxID=2896530 RepID=UPI001F165BEB|nr:hypothetical protein [Amycolatopsis sp. GM8]
MGGLENGLGNPEWVEIARRLVATGKVDYLSWVFGRITTPDQAEGILTVCTFSGCLAGSWSTSSVAVSYVHG